MFKEIKGLGVSYTSEDKSEIENDTNKVARFKDWEKVLKKDPYLFEALQVLQEF